MDKENRNTVIFMVFAMVLLLLYEQFVIAPRQHAAQQAAALAAAAAAKQHAVMPTATTTASAPDARIIPASQRVAINTPKLGGSIALVGARFDDLYLKAYRAQPDPKSPLISLLRPANADHPWLAEMRWESADPKVRLPNADALWTAAPGAVLTPTTLLQLTYDNGQGLVFHRTIAVDADYMFAVADSVTNTGAKPVSLNAYDVIAQHGQPAEPSNSTIVFEGAIGELAGKLSLARYSCHFGMLFCNDWSKKEEIQTDSTGGWLGLTQKYWLTALIPDQTTPIRAEYQIQHDGDTPVYEVDYRGPVQTIAPGATVTQTSRLFAGAKIAPLLQHYSKTLGIPQLDNSVDWGVYWFFTRPLFGVLEFFNSHLGSFAAALLSLTVAVRLVFFPIANKAYESSSKMKKIAPAVEAIKKKYPDNPTEQQKETMALYQREKINPLMGCLPLLIQIPVFYSLYKVLSVTIEMRQAPFFGWLKDLSARDPTSLWNLFGLIHWNPATAPLVGHLLDTSLHIGIWPVLYGFTMWLTQSMSPSSPDPAQQRIFALMPIIFAFTLSQFTVGLLIYWTWSNLLAIVQQYVNMHHYKVENPIDDLLERLFKPKAATG
jgi:YidC/Oxa1 family membrane protein insertase